MSPKLDDKTQPVQSDKKLRGDLDVVLRVLEPKSQASTRKLVDRLVLGSGSDVDLTIDDRTVSRRHAEFSRTADGILVRDLESRNGSFYLDQRFESMVLSVGACVRLGKALIVLEVDPHSIGDPGLFTATRYHGLMGHSSKMRRLFALLERLEHVRIPVLLEGESGSGKELVARALHASSSVGSGPFLALNCAALPRDLVASELFGHRRGAFTGATESRRGAFDLADGGTLFLDEIGEIAIELQAVLLRALETGEIRPVGSEQTRRVDVRIVAATNRDLAQAVSDGEFREDLYFRLAVVKLGVPPLRERREDIEPLARHFAEEAGGELSDVIIEQLKRRSFRGNVRELRNVVQSHIALGTLPDEVSAQGASVDITLGELSDVTRPYAEQKDALVARFTRAYLTQLLAHTQGNLSAAARLAGLDRGHLRRLVERYVRGGSGEA